ncbi:MAG: hypothetical protein IKK24_04860 [Clostridia bacterium]|nr:hypothetical protein [Clostridia bacterium]
MPVIFYSDIDKLNSLEKDPYASFTKKFKGLKKLDGQQIELKIDNGKEGFYKGFFTDDRFMENANLSFVFAEMNNVSEPNSKPFFIRMIYSFGCNNENIHYYQKRIKLLKKRVPYFFIPDITNLEFSSHIDDEFNMQFDVLVKSEDKVLQVCHSLINQIITIFSFED